MFDYHDADCAQKIKDCTKSSIRYVLDCISTKESYTLIAQALPYGAEIPVQLITLLPADTWPRKDIVPTTMYVLLCSKAISKKVTDYVVPCSLAYTSLRKAFTKFGIDFPPIPSHFEFGAMFWKLSNDLLASGMIKHHPVSLRNGGLSGIPAG
jgi:hypothetical protein